MDIKGGENVAFIWDLLLLAMAAGMTIAAWQKTVLSSALTAGALFTSMLLAWLLSVPVAIPLNSLAVAPVVRQRAANEVADMFSSPHLSGGEETVRDLDLASLILTNPSPLARLEKTLGVEHAFLEELALRIGEEKDVPDVSVRLLRGMTDGFAGALARALAFLILFMLLFPLTRLLAGRIEANAVVRDREKPARRAISAALGALSGLVLVLVLSALGVLLRPCLHGTQVSLLAGMLDESILHTMGAAIIGRLPLRG